MRDLKKEINREILNYIQKFGKKGTVLLLGEEEWCMLQDGESVPFVDEEINLNPDGVGFDDDGYVDKLWSLTVYRTHDKSILRIGGTE